jgi:sugar (Glycoside-Pentoside-Hexuronide) transporter
MRLDAAAREGIKLKTATKLGYGLGDLGTNLALNATTLYLLYYYTDVFGVSPAFAGAVFLVAKLWNACIDPFVGQLVDRTRTKRGRKRPFLLFGALPFGLALFLVFAGPDIAPGLRPVWAIASFLLFCTALAFVNIPYSALTVSMTGDAQERSSLSGYRMTFAIVGTLLAGAAVKPLVGLFPTETTGFRAAGAIIGAILAALILVAYRSSFEREEGVDANSRSFRENMRTMLANGPFLLLAFALVLCTVANYVLASTLNYYFKYVLGSESLVSLGFAALFGAAIASVPLWLAVAKRWGKKAAFIAGMVLLAAVLVALRLAGRPPLPLFLGFLVLAGVGVSTIYLFPWAMVPDTVEYSRWKSGVAQESFLYGFYTFGLKLAQALAGFLVGLALQIIGYVPNAAQGPGVESGIAFIMTILPCAFLVVGLVLLGLYPIGPKRYAQIEEELKSRE